MVINVVGPIAAGKSTFCRWFEDKHPSFYHFDISFFRKMTNNEDEAWDTLRSAIHGVDNSIIESTGLHYRLPYIWSPKLVKQGIYTIKFMNKIEILNERIIKRGKENVILINDEIFENEVFHSTYHELPTNLAIYMVDESVYLTIEKYILNAKRRIERRKRK